jgi:hypothetical protein
VIYAGYSEWLRKQFLGSRRRCDLVAAFCRNKLCLATAEFVLWQYNQVRDGEMHHRVAAATAP